MQKKIRLLAPSWNKVALFFSLLVLIAHIFLARWAFPQADNFAFAADAAKHGIFGNVVQGYQYWEGRFSSYFLMEAIGISAIFPYDTNLLLMVSLAIFAGALFIIIRKMDNQNTPLAGLDVAFLFLALPREVKAFSLYFGLQAAESSCNCPHVVNHTDEMQHYKGCSYICEGSAGP